MNPETKPSLRRALRTVALFEAAKGAVVLLAGLGLLALIDRDVQDIAERLVRLSHLNPASRYPRIFLEAAEKITDRQLLMLAVAAGAYAAVRLIEAYGLWHGRRWAEWFALLAGGLFLPVEIFELFKHATPLKAGVFIVNLAIVLYMIYELRRPAGTTGSAPPVRPADPATPPG